MARTINIGAQGFERPRANGSFYVDKTGFVRDWWMAQDDVTLVCRSMRFGKTLNLDTVLISLNAYMRPLPLTQALCGQAKSGPFTFPPPTHKRNTYGTDADWLHILC